MIEHATKGLTNVSYFGNGRVLDIIESYYNEREFIITVIRDYSGYPSGISISWE
jgi:hypothetical protein